MSNKTPTPPLEKTIVAAIVKALKAAGVTWLIKTHGGPFQGSGLPDILAIAPATGRLVGIEVKRPRVGRLTALQAAQIERINQAGGVAGVAYGTADALNLFGLANGDNFGDLPRINGGHNA